MTDSVARLREKAREGLEHADAAVASSHVTAGRLILERAIRTVAAADFLLLRHL